MAKGQSLVFFCLVTRVTQCQSGATFGFALCYAGCVLACEGIVGPGTGLIGTPACIGGCAAACTCFEPETEVTTSAGPTPLSKIRLGDFVGTLDFDGKLTYTEVEANVFMPGNISFIKFIFEEPRRMELSVTEDHPMLVSTGYGYSFVPAHSVVVGQKMPTFPERNALVAEVQRTMARGKYVLTTEQCSVIANGILTGTTCVDNDRWVDMMSMNTRSAVMTMIKAMNNTGHNHDDAVDYREMTTFAPEFNGTAVMVKEWLSQVAGMMQGRSQRSTTKDDSTLYEGSSLSAFKY